MSTLYESLPHFQERTSLLLHLMLEQQAAQSTGITLGQHDDAGHI